MSKDIVQDTLVILEDAIGSNSNLRDGALMIVSLFLLVHSDFIFTKILFCLCIFLVISSLMCTEICLKLQIAQAVSQPEKIQSKIDFFDKVCTYCNWLGYLCCLGGFVLYILK